MGEVSIYHQPPGKYCCFYVGVWLIQVIDDVGVPSVIITLSQAKLPALTLCHQHLICVCCSPPTVAM